MNATVRHVGFHNAAIAFPLLERRALAVNTANLQLAVGNEQTGASTGVALPLLAIRYWASSAQYVAGDFVIFSGQIYKAITTITPGAFNPAQWVGMTDGGQFLLRDGTREMFGNLEIEKAGPALVLNAVGATQADIWFRRDGLTRWLIRAKETADVDLIVARFDDGGFVIDAPLTISRATGRLSVLTNPTLPLELAPKQYVDARIAAAVPDVSGFVNRSGDTMTGALSVPVFYIDSLAGGYSDLYYRNAGVVRWLVRGGDPTTDNYEVHHYDAAGTYLGAAMWLDNATGAANFQQNVSVAGAFLAPPGLTFGGAAPTGFYGDGTNVAIRTYGNNDIYFQGANGTNTYGHWGYNGLYVSGLLQATAQDGLRNEVPAGNHARSYYHVAGVRVWTAGVYADGRYAIGDESAGTWRMIINLDGSVDFNGPVRVSGPLNVTGTVTAGGFSGPGAGGGGGTGTFTSLEDVQYIDFKYPGDAWDYSARLIVTTPSPGSAGHSKATFYTDELTISGNLKVNGTLSTAGGGSGIATYSGYATRQGTSGSATPGAFNISNWPPGNVHVWIDDTDYGPIVNSAGFMALEQRIAVLEDRLKTLEARLA
jgi:hypothetical protein